MKIDDIAYVRFKAPDLGQMQVFLTEFGLMPTMAADGILYARGAGTAPFVHATEVGEAGFAALGLRARSVGDLESLAASHGLKVEANSAPGGGMILRMRDPDGTAVEIVAGQTPLDPLPLEPEPPRNSAAKANRTRQPVRLSHGPSHVVRLGHCVLEVTDFRKSEAWYKSLFGFITSDEIEMAPGIAIGAFMRCDRGDQPTDHHTLFLLQTPNAPAFNHAAFEVTGFDDLMRGHSHLKHQKREAAWGVGRHILGSQIFDYWRDPWGHELEHWTDGDVFTAADESGKASFRDLLSVQWGPAHPMLVAQGGSAE